jgi:phage FluMu gp28-like protein
MATIFVDMVANFCRLFSIPMKRDTNGLVELFNGSKIFGVSSNPKAIRGKSADIVIDEYSFHENPEELLHAAIPLMTWGYTVELLSSLGAKTHPFYKTYLDAVAGTNTFKPITTTIHDAIKDGLATTIWKVQHKTDEFTGDEEEVNQSFLEYLKGLCSTSTFRREFECLSPIDEQDVVITSENYNNCKEPVDFELTEGDIILGIDIGRSQNLTTIWGLREVVNDKGTIDYETCYTKEIFNKPLSEQYDIIDGIIEKGTGIVKVNIDQGLIGKSIAEDLQAKYGQKIEPVQIGSKNKAEMIETTRKYVEHARITLPDENCPNFERIKEDLCAMSIEVGSTGIIRYDGSTSFSHCDYFMALALAIKDASNEIKLSWAL